MDAPGSPHVLELARLPSLSRVYARLARAHLGRRKARAAGDAAAMPQARARASGVRFDAEHLERYREVCGFEPGPDVPITYLQALVAGLQAELLLTPGFPLPPLGVVLVGSSMTLHRPIDVGVALDLGCELGAGRGTDRGLELDLLARASTAEGPVWEASSTVLWRRPHERRPQARPPSAITGRRVSWYLPAGSGRRYAAVSGDYNPIHLFTLTARLFGFRRPIAHGLWLLARALAEVAGAAPPAPYRVDVSFLRPVLLPAEVALVVQPAGGGADFALLARDVAKAYLEGRIRRL